jgi:glycosyltransferase involved in cell wall biosynthesis
MSRARRTGDNRGVDDHRIEPEAAVSAQRGDAVVCIRGCSRREQFAACLRSVLKHTADHVRILICDDAGPDTASRRRAIEAAPAGRAIAAGSLVDALACAAPADVAILDSDCLVASGWLEGLRQAAYGDVRVATAGPLSNTGALGAPLRPEELERAAGSVLTHPLGIRPRVPAPDGPCTYVRRSALELIQAHDPTSARGKCDKEDFSRRCLEAGLCHVVADNVLVLALGDGDARIGAAPRQPTGPQARSLAAARRAIDGLSLVIDARILGGPMNGTKLHVLELIAAVARTESARVTAIVPTDLGADVRALLQRLPTVTLARVAPGAEPPPDIRGDVVHRPFQIAAPADLTFLARLGDRLVITHQDLISYHNPSYFPSSEAWTGYRALTRRGLGAADQVLFFSAHARNDALAEDLVDPQRASVVQIGVDHRLSGAKGQNPVAPSSAEQIADGAPMMLCLGTDFRHKNRMFALQMLEELQRSHQWRGWLVLAGPRVAFGSSIPDERRLLAARPELAKAVLELDAVSEAEKAWLLHRASLVLYPTVHEGFGLIPFEAADHGVPCLWAPGTALSEVLPDVAAGIVPWDAAASADRALALMGDERLSERAVKAVRTAGAELSWDRTAERLIDIYRSACDEPPTLARASERADGVMQDDVSEDGMRLVGPGGALPRDVERPLLALATHPRVATPVFRAIKAGYRVSYRWRRSARRHDATAD